MYSLGHDLRAPIHSALGLIALSKDEQDLATLHQYNDLKEKSLIRLDNFIQDILDYSRNSHTELRIIAVNLSQEVQNIIELNQNLKDNENVQTFVNIHQDFEFYTDKYRMNLILNNLISNAFRYQNPQNQNQWVAIDATVNESQAKIVVRDNGIGIGQEHLDKVFQMFYRATNQVKGSGLGLYIVQEAIHRLEGKIQLDSQAGVGTSFTIELPNLHFTQTNPA
jgi:signal transduction histidine kinase